MKDPNEQAAAEVIQDSARELGDAVAEEMTRKFIWCFDCEKRFPDWGYRRSGGEPLCPRCYEENMAFSPEKPKRVTTPEMMDE